MESIEAPFSGYTGRGVRVAMIDSGVNPAHPHVRGVAGGIRIGAGGTEAIGDYLDYCGHGTAVAGAIREKAPDALLYAVKVFDRRLTTNIGIIVKAIEWAVEHEMTVINLSLGTANPDHREKLEEVVERAVRNNIVIVAAHRLAGRLLLPGYLPEALGVEEDAECPRHSYKTSGPSDDPVFITSPYPRDIPGVPRERNLNGISFAVANMSGIVTRAKEMLPAASVASLKRLLAAQGDGQD
jgi:hypothetical protein